MVENNQTKLLIQPPELVSKLRDKFLILAALLTKEVGFVAVISWLGEISPFLILDAFFGWPTLIIVCSCHMMDAENNLKAISIEAIFTLITLCASTLQTEF